MWKRYGAYLRRAAELTVAWRDTETSARGWLVVNSFRGGAAGGGTRMRTGLRPREVVYLAKTMELKFALSGPAIGGAKGGIDFDPADPRKGEVLERWYRAIAPYLHERYGTGGDLGVDEVADVLPCCERLGLEHPQEGIVRGHFRPGPVRFQRIIQSLDEGVKAHVNGRLGLPGGQLTVADMVTGYGVASAIRALHERQGRSLEGVRVLLEGFGNVGASCGLYLARAGARVVGIMDAEKALIEPAGLDAAGMEDLVRRSRHKLIPEDDDRLRYGSAREEFWRQKADVFVAAALSATLGTETLDRLQAAGVRVIACGANQPFRERSLGSTWVQQRADRSFSILPDVIANCGMARTFGYLMAQEGKADPEHILAAVDRTITSTLDEVLDRAVYPSPRARDGRPTSLLAATLGLALDRIGAA